MKAMLNIAIRQRKFSAKIEDNYWEKSRTFFLIIRMLLIVFLFISIQNLVFHNLHIWWIAWKNDNQHVVKLDESEQLYNTCVDTIENIDSKTNANELVRRKLFNDLIKLYALIDTFACSTAVCEASFSALSQINIPSRISMTNERMRNLAFIAFEHKRLANVSIDNILGEFNNKKDRKVQLF